MRILITTGLFPTDSDGYATYSRALFTMLPREGITVSVLPFSHVHRYPKFIQHVVFFFLVCREARGTQVVFAPDSIPIGLSALCAAFLMRKKFVLKIESDYAWEQALERFGFLGTVEEFQTAELPLMPRLLRSIERFTARCAEVIIIPSKHMKNVVLLWGVPAVRLQVIYNGVESFGAMGNKAVLRGLINFRGKLIISVARLVPWNGFKELIHALPHIQKRFPDTKLLIVGDGPDLSNLEREAAAGGFSNQVIFTGALERDILLRYIRAADVFVLHTAYEGMSRHLLEAMAVGVPVVTTQVGGNSEILEDGRNGFLVAVHDIGTLTARVIEIFEHTMVRALLIANGKRTANQFSLEAMITETARVIKKL